MKSILFLFSICTTELCAQVYFTNKSNDTKYIGFTSCNTKVSKWCGRLRKEDVLSLKYKGIVNDTITYSIKFKEMFSLWETYEPDDSQEGLILQLQDDCIYLSYPKNWFTISRQLPDKFKLIDFADRNSEIRNGKGYFLYDEFSVKQIDKKFSLSLNDTIYQYKMEGINYQSHAAIINGFLFCKKYGFIRWDYPLQEGRDENCTGYLIDKRLKRYLLPMLRSGFIN